MEEKIQRQIRLTLKKLPVILTAASLANHGVLVSIKKGLSFKNVDLGSVPAGQLGSLAACLKDPTKGNIQSANGLGIENVTNCDFISIMDNVEIVDLLLDKVTLLNEDTKSIARAMTSGRVRVLTLGKEGVTLDINTMLVNYKGEGRCSAIKAFGESAKKYKNDIKKWAMHMGWKVKNDYRDEIEIVRK